MVRKILIIGAGGIGSYLIDTLDNLTGNGTHDSGLYEITVSDPDTVETKNITYQRFSADDVGKNKALVMKNRYNMVVSGSKYPIMVEDQLTGYDLVVCCVDNLHTRRMLYRANVEEIKWLDLRSQGRNAALVSYKAEPSTYDTLLAGPEGSFSCQGDSWNGSTEGIHFMHSVIAGVGAQWMQRWFAGESVNPFMVVNV
tara:strand:- start:2500 stop:3093 length:594 start_codon:yes stop_codon:yes gene_type:complete